MTPAERIAAALEKREKLKAAEAEAFAEQQAADIEALVELEAEHGFERILRIDLNGWKPGMGAATMVVARVPLASESLFKRFEQTIAKAKPNSTEGHTAAIQLGEACIVYPPRPKPAEMAGSLYAATMELAPGVISNVALQVSKAVQGQAEEEKKG